MMKRDNNQSQHKREKNQKQKMISILESEKDKVINDQENSYLLEIQCTPQNISKILNLDMRILDELSTEKNLCAPLKKIDMISIEFRDDVKKGLDNLQILVDHSSQLFNISHQGQLNGLANEIANSYVDAPQTEKQEIIEDLKKIVMFLQEKMDTISQSFKVEQLNRMIDVVKEQGKLISTFNHQVISRTANQEKQSQQLIQKLKETKKDYQKKINDICIDLKKQQSVISEKKKEQEGQVASLIDQKKKQNFEQLKVDQQSIILHSEEKKFRAQQQYDNNKLEELTKQRQDLQNDIQIQNQKKEDMQLEVEREQKNVNKNQADLKKISFLEQALNKLWFFSNKKSDIQKEICQIQTNISFESQGKLQLAMQQQSEKTEAIDEQIQEDQSRLNSNSEEISNLQQRKITHEDEMSSYKSALVKLKNEIKNIQLDIGNTQYQIENCQSEITMNEQIVSQLEQTIKKEKGTQNQELKKIEISLTNIKEEICKLKKLVPPAMVLDSLNKVVNFLEKLNESQSNTQKAFTSSSQTIQNLFQSQEQNTNALGNDTSKRKINKLVQSVKEINQSLGNVYTSLTTNVKEIDELSNIRKQLQSGVGTQQINK